MNWIETALYLLLPDGMASQLIARYDHGQVMLVALGACLFWMLAIAAVAGVVIPALQATGNKTPS